MRQTRSPKISRGGIRLVVAGVMLFVAGGGAGWFVKSYAGAMAHQRGRIIREGPGHLTNPLLACEIADKETFVEFKPVAAKLRSFVNDPANRKGITDVSVYLRTLNTGRWLGIDEDKEYTAASLMKVGVLLAYLRLAEDNPALLKDKLTYAGEANPELTNVMPEENLVKGKTYSVEDLLKNLIVYSNNTPLALLVNHIPAEAFREAYKELHLPFPHWEEGNVVDLTSPKDYSLVFRVLYGATYVDRNASEKALELLTQTRFDQGLRAGVPSEITVAHKFGAANVKMLKDAAAKELHDCGIVYYPEHPYFLCVMTRQLEELTLKKERERLMTRQLAEVAPTTVGRTQTFWNKMSVDEGAERPRTRGTDFHELSSMIAGVSRVAYESIDAYFKNGARNQPRPTRP